MLPVGKRGRAVPRIGFSIIAETNLMDEYGLRRACQCAGDSLKNDALVRKTDFVDDGNSASKSDAICAAEAKSDAIRASTTEQKPNKKTHCEESWILTVRCSGRYWT